MKGGNLMSEELSTQRVERHLIDSHHKLYSIFDDLSFKSKNLYNYANYHIRQIFILTSKLAEKTPLTKEQEIFLSKMNQKVDEFNTKRLKKFETDQAKSPEKFEGKEYKPISHFGSRKKYANYEFLDFLLKESADYKALPSKTSQQTLKLLDKNWKSFFGSIKDWKVNPQNYTGRPKLPKYKKKDGRFNVIFTNQQCKLKNGCITFPNIFCGRKIPTKVNKNLQQVRMKPNGNTYVMEVVYKMEPVEMKKIHPKRIASIDIGVNNFATVTNNIDLQPFVINGQGIKSINQYYNKQRAKMVSDLKRNHNQDWSNRLQRLTDKRNRWVENFLHQASGYIKKYCVEYQIESVVIGYNPGFKQEVNVGKVNNQNFVQIPFKEFMSKLEYKLADIGIKLVVQEESYTSKASFLDGDDVPVYDSNKKEKHSFSGKRITRGLYQSKNKTMINADCNGSYNILRKAFPEAFSGGIEGVGLHPIRVNVVTMCKRRKRKCA